MQESQRVPIILASGSPRRQQLLGKLGLAFDIIVSDAAEPLTPGLSAAEQAIELAERKARAVAAGLNAGLVLGADTIVVLDSDILGKPRNDADAFAMLRRLSGRDHQVITGLSLVDVASGRERHAAVATTVIMRELTDAEIADYVATGEPQDKAGAYAIQGVGAALVSQHQGCYANVVGLPLCATAGLLADAGVLPFDFDRDAECMHAAQSPDGRD